MKFGPAWVVFEESFHLQTKTLISVMPPHKSLSYVAKHVEQLLVDRTASLEEKLRYKKSQKFAYSPLISGGSVIHCGHEPFLVAIHASQTWVENNSLCFRYKTTTQTGDNPEDYRVEDRVGVIEVRA